MRRASGFEEAVAAIEARGYGIKPGLERMEQLVRLLDYPQLKFPAIHISGTNGKTSIARMAGALLAAHGLKTGIYVSPHLETIRERYILTGPDEDGKLVSHSIPEEEFTSTFRYLAPFVELIEGRSGEDASPSGESGVTLFELTTLLAFEWMAEKAVAAGVIEAGMGGRWDATNVIQAQVAVIGPVDLDHTDLLGTSPVEQAAEKAGIIKIGADVVSAPQSPDVLDVIERTAASKEATLSVLGRDLHIESDQPGVGGRLVSISTKFGSYRDLYLPLFGRHQAENLAVAVAAAEFSKAGRLDESALRPALESLSVPGRLEPAGTKPLVILDGAHNPSAARALAAAVRESFASMPVTLVLTIFKDKDARGILDQLLPLASTVIMTRSSSPRAADPYVLADLASSADVSVRILEPLGGAVDEAISSSSEADMVLVTGSLYGVGEARSHLRTRGADLRP